MYTYAFTNAIEWKVCAYVDDQRNDAQEPFC
jgi:hypothetical protein